jgi:hypothetical protein
LPEAGEQLLPGQVVEQQPRQPELLGPEQGTHGVKDISDRHRGAPFFAPSPSTDCRVLPLLGFVGAPVIL